MLSPIGRNALFCCLRYGDQLQNIASITKLVVRGYVWYAQSPDVIYTARCLLELLYVKHGYSSIISQGSKTANVKINDYNQGYLASKWINSHHLLWALGPISLRLLYGICSAPEAFRAECTS